MQLVIFRKLILGGSPKLVARKLIGYNQPTHHLKPKEKSMLQQILPLAAGLLQETTTQDIPMPSATVLLLLFFALVFIVAWRLLANRAEMPLHHAAEHTEPHLAAHAEAPTRAAVIDLPDVTLDDLTIVEGIGPKIKLILNEAGINTFKELSETSPEYLSELLRAKRLPNVPVTWPEQARLASLGDWDGLKTLQQNLTAGRRA
jgi:hypothetical protein